MEEIVKYDPKFIDILTKGKVSLPFVHDVPLMRCHVAGTSFRDDIEDIEPDLKVDDILVFKREPDNAVDDFAIRIYHQENRLIGYVPQLKNEAVAGLMDAGKMVYGKIEKKRWKGDWLKIRIKVFMHDL